MMANWRRQPRRILGLAAASLSLLLVQNAFSFPVRQTSANLRPGMLYHHLDSLVGVVLTASSHIVDDLETLYELRQLALGASQAEKSSVPVSLNSPPASSAQSVVCNYRAVTVPGGTEHRCLLSGRGSTHVSSVRRC
jgi:hypothetical protein